MKQIVILATIILITNVPAREYSSLPEVGLLAPNKVELHLGPSFISTVGDASGFMDIIGRYLVLTPSLVLYDILGNTGIGLSFKAEYDLKSIGFATSIRAIKYDKQKYVIINSYGLGPALLCLANAFVGINICYEEELYATYFINVNIRFLYEIFNKSKGTSVHIPNY